MNCLGPLLNPVGVKPSARWASTRPTLVESAGPRPWASWGPSGRWSCTGPTASTRSPPPTSTQAACLGGRPSSAAARRSIPTRSGIARAEPEATWRGGEAPENAEILLRRVLGRRGRGRPRTSLRSTREPLSGPRMPRPPTWPTAWRGRSASIDSRVARRRERLAALVRATAVRGDRGVSDPGRDPRAEAPRARRGAARRRDGRRAARPRARARRRRPAASCEALLSREPPRPG